MSRTGERIRLEPVRSGATATTIELFFDLVFVFALTQVTAFMGHHGSWHGLLQGVLIMALLWWSWASYAWLGNVVKADEGATRFAMFAAMGAMFILALAIPEAFEDGPGGLHAPAVIALGYLFFRAIHLGMFWVAAREDPVLRSQLVRFAVSMGSATTLLLAAAGADGRTQTALWCAALAADYLGTAVIRAERWRLRSPTHFAERHGLIVIVALGESIVAIGVGIAQRPITAPIVVGSLFGLSLAAALWWTYFDTSSLLAERALASCPEQDRPRMARDAYSFLHLPLIAGVVLVALGQKKVLEYVSDTEHHGVSDALSPVPLAALVLGVVLFLVGQAAFMWRTCRVVKWHRLAVAVALLPMLALGREIVALGSLAVVTGALMLMLAWESRRFAEDRHRIRHAPAHHDHDDAHHGGA